MGNARRVHHIRHIHLCLHDDNLPAGGQGLPRGLLSPCQRLVVDRRIQRRIRPFVAPVSSSHYNQLERGDATEDGAYRAFHHRKLVSIFPPTKEKGAHEANLNH